MGTYHAGELAVQERAGVRDMAKRVGNGIHDEIPAAAAEFMRTQPFAIIGSTDTHGSVWASVVHGEPGFLRAIGTKTAQVDALPDAGDPLSEALARASDGEDVKIGMLMIELETRRRMRLNGQAIVLPNGGFQIQADQVYANCPKYIQKRVWEPSNTLEQTMQTTSQGRALTPEQQALIARADTFFVASAAVDGSADASHRGGAAGFVRVVNAGRLLWPDYSGNTMFNTLGNIAVNPHAGLLFLDFETGGALQLTGRARIVWDEALIAEFDGAERLVSFDVDRVIATEGAVPGRFRFLQASPFNP